MAAVIITICQVFYRVAVFLEFIHTRIDTSDYVAVRIIFTDRKVLLILNRQCGKLLLKNLAGNARQSLICVSSFAFVIGTPDYIPIRSLEIGIQRLIVITEAQIIHCKTFIC